MPDSPGDFCLDLGSSWDIPQVTAASASARIADLLKEQTALLHHLADALGRQRRRGAPLARLVGSFHLEIEREIRSRLSAEEERVFEGGAGPVIRSTAERLARALPAATAADDDGEVDFGAPREPADGPAGGRIRVESDAVEDA